MFLIQRLTLAAVIVLLIDFPTIQIVSILASNVIFAWYMIKVKPMLSEIQNVNIVVDEVVLFLSNVGFLFMHLLDMLDTDKVILGWAVVAVVCFAIIKNLIIALKESG